MICESSIAAVGPDTTSGCWLQPYGRVVGFDLNQGGVAMTNASGAAVVRADAAHAPFASDTFDIATSFDVMQCLEPTRPWFVRWLGVRVLAAPSS